MKNMDEKKTSQQPQGKREKGQPDFAQWAHSMLQTNLSTRTSKQTNLAGTLSIVATPIGNKGDISLRSLWVLSCVDAVLCEDTRVTGALLRGYGLQKKLISCHAHNEASRIPPILARLKEGQALAYVSDAGTPLVSDPGFRLVQACRQEGIPVYPCPGANAALAALMAAGLQTDHFFFYGFLPAKTVAREKALKDLAPIKATLIFYEAPQRVLATLKAMRKIFGPTRTAACARELTKLYETFLAAPLDDLVKHFEQTPPKGEFVLLVEADEEKPAQDEASLDQHLSQALEIMSLRDASALLAQTLKCGKKEIYARALRLKKKQTP
ncbi:MAG: 16S rRNA (cytidine(1402)-2'-O)-methyltransferase [Alphaproteobacteria bacterium]|nr:16S rRNA (cytidine(1402)-2'-O)-methyltransferase [Alphaproteobacteria bacterium]